MIGSIGFPEVIMIFIVVLLLFGPDKLPEFAKMMGKTIRDFRRTVNEAKATLEDEIEKADISGDIKGIEKDIREGTDITRAVDKSDFIKDLKEMKSDIEDIKRFDYDGKSK